MLIQRSTSPLFHRLRLSKRPRVWRWTFHALPMWHCQCGAEAMHLADLCSRIVHMHSCTVCGVMHQVAARKNAVLAYCIERSQKPWPKVSVIFSEYASYEFNNNHHILSTYIHAHDFIFDGKKDEHLRNTWAFWSCQTALGTEVRSIKRQLWNKAVTADLEKQMQERKLEPTWTLTHGN